MRQAQSKVNLTSNGIDYTAGNAALAMDDYSAGTINDSQNIIEDSYFDRMRESLSLMKQLIRILNLHSQIDQIETVLTQENKKTMSKTELSRRLSLGKKLSLLEQDNEDAARLRSGPAKIARELLEDVLGNSEETPVLYTSPDGGLVVDFLDHDKRLTLVIDDEFCVFTLTREGKTSQKSIDLPSRGFHAEVKSFLTKFSE